MSIRLQYAYLKEHTWMYRRNYPQAFQPFLGVKAFKQSLNTGDAKLAKVRIAELNVIFEGVLTQARAGIIDLPQRPSRKKPPLLTVFGSRVVAGLGKVSDLSRLYLNRRSNELRHGGFKSVRFSVGLFKSVFGDRAIGQLSRDDGRLFLRLISELSPHVGKSFHCRFLGLEELVQRSKTTSLRITPQTQRRIFTQVCHFLEWAVYEGHLEASPFRSVRVEQKSRPNSYAVLTDEEVLTLLQSEPSDTIELVRLCLLSGMRAGEAAGLLREDLVFKGSLGWFALIRPNELRSLKTGAAERLVPLHPMIQERLTQYPSNGPLFPNLDVSKVTKGFSKLTTALGIKRPCLVFHSTRKWFITQCERSGVPEHFTATLVGHQSARSENRMTYSIYSAGISDEQKRAIIDGIRLPSGAS